MFDGAPVPWNVYWLNRMPVKSRTIAEAHWPERPLAIGVLVFVNSFFLCALKRALCVRLTELTELTELNIPNELGVSISGLHNSIRSTQTMLSLIRLGRWSQTRPDSKTEVIS